MASQPNPFHAALGGANHLTLAELEAATIGSNGFQMLQRQVAQPRSEYSKVSAWLSDQGVHMGDEYFVEVDEPKTPRSNRHNPIFIPDDDSESAAQPPGGAARVGTAAARTPRGVPPYTPPSSRHFSSKKRKRKVPEVDEDIEDVLVVQPPSSTPTRRKRKVSEVDEDIEEVIVVQTPSSTPTRRPRPTPIIDLTQADRSKRTRSFMGNMDDDVIIVDPPAPTVRRELQAFLRGEEGGSNLPPGERLRPMNTEPAAGVEGMPHDSTAPEANANETLDLLRSVEAMTHFFTLATETRDKIYRHLLVSPRPIHVRHLWTDVARRSIRRGGRGDDIGGTNIDIGILTVCRRAADEGTRILYSENTFLYQLRDPEVVEVVTGGGRRSKRVANRREQENRSINLAKYGNLIRHMAIELEANRTATSYEKLMSAALETLAPNGAESLPSPPRPLCSSIHLHTLTITISPLFEPSHRIIRVPGNNDTVIREGRFLSMVSFFSRGAPVLKALQRLNVEFLRINVHVNSDLGVNGLDAANSWLDSAGDDPDDSDDDSHDDSHLSSHNAQQPKKRHLETTIDLRYLPRHMETLRRQPGPAGPLWENDVLMQEKQRQKGAAAEDALAHLRRHIEDACLRPEFAMRGIWEDHGAAEQRRREQRVKEDARFDADAYDDAGDEEGADEDSEDEDRAARRTKSLIISIDRVGQQLRAYRA
ncbi:hypothetical protein CHGG_07222 [Chaetomium globosum CBS 148.51]|uniref:Uncharacterized protein n=1 Tax=Chaetomium globosum (strain ATCC 6205 / CBS 148.51 / DSM 1962 / NBRC 6347 / NRRL 1970) TaxID=306901 RepID=Q2GXT2_CHAGB|nr:uncharacterized protein CHGG_07222 [Chaetomium globosum CBS 148.51]EAQ85969.1 hypothetical protein CHGG_07222 [Chaetomium globosum CBS 148.51]